jgi:hypothetical protein
MNEQLIEASRQGRLEDVKRLLATREEWDIKVLLACIQGGHWSAVDWFAKRYGQRPGILEASFRELVHMKKLKLAQYVIGRIPPFYFPYVNYLDLFRLVEDEEDSYNVTHAIEESWEKTTKFLLKEDKDRIKEYFPVPFGPGVPEVYGTILSNLIRESKDTEILKWAIDLNPPYRSLWFAFREKDIPELNDKIERELVERPERDMVGMTEDQKNEYIDQEMNRRVKYVVERIILEDKNVDKVSKVLDIVDELRERYGDRIQLKLDYHEICSLFEFSDEGSDLEKYTYQQLVDQPYDKISEFLLKPEIANWVVDYLIDQVAHNDRYRQNPMYRYLKEVEEQLKRLLMAFEKWNNIESTLLVVNVYRDYAERIHPLLRHQYQDDAQYRAAVDVGPMFDRGLIIEMLLHVHHPRMLAFWLDQLGTGPVPWQAGRYMGEYHSSSKIREQSKLDAEYQAWSMTTNPEMRRLYLEHNPEVRKRVDQMRLAMVRGLDPQNPGQLQLPTELRARINQFL